jgi:hypothetical protein
MREQEMRMRVFRFLTARMRNMIMPATVGIGLAVSGCVKSSAVYEAQMPQDANPPHADVLGPDSQPPGSDQASPGPDLALADTREVQSDSAMSADLAPDLAVTRDLAVDKGADTAAAADQAPGHDSSGIDGARTDAIAGIDGSDDLGGTAVKYSAPVLDASGDLGAITTKDLAPQPDAAADTGAVVALYSAQTPDAGVPRDGLAVRYMAQMPDA